MSTADDARPGLSGTDSTPLRAPSGPAPIERLRAVMAALRDPATGCPWDIQQNFATIAPYTIEEAYEVAEAVQQGDMTGLKEELGDLLLQVVFHARMAEEAGIFDFDAVAAAIVDKMLRRHPHVFGGARIADAAEQNVAWETHKAAERAAKTPAEAGVASALEGVGVALPALMRAIKLQKRAATVGFDWKSAGPVLDKIEEEIGELRAEMAEPDADFARIADEVGDVLFACANLARHLGVDPETALRMTNAKFERRFRRVESLLAERTGKRPEQVDLAALERLWVEAKMEERQR